MRTLASIRYPLNFLSAQSWLREPSITTRSLSTESLPTQSRGGLPRFHSQILPTSKGEVVRVEGDEFWHMTKVLRLGLSDRVELFNGTGGLLQGCIQSIDRNGSDIIALEEPSFLCPEGIQWHIFAAFSTLKGGRADWLIEKCTELGASSVTPLLTERSPTITDNRMDRLERVILAAIKQCQRLHKMTLNPPMKLHSIPSFVSGSRLSFVALAESTPLLNALSLSSAADVGVLIVGPEGDFTVEEVKLLTDAGATPVGLGPCRLRVETATVAMLSAAVLWSDAVKNKTVV
ncbi:hypothetical protein KSP39_PZI015185 [Platanthera zijinensis]|uniref:16S rRNA (uracil(1498)-N(3))-methyltransferase n=1 Tax=Platanthera zijinensis TaxID=2320716 RepID=A0AAP0B7W7_9ASPA